MCNACCGWLPFPGMVLLPVILLQQRWVGATIRQLVAMHRRLFVLQVAAISKGGEVLSQWLHLPTPAAALLFTAALGTLCYRLVAPSRQWSPRLTASYLVMLTRLSKMVPVHCLHVGLQLRVVF